LDQQSEHLSDAQIEQYGDWDPGAEQNAGEREAHQRLDVHLTDCGLCRSRVLDFQRTRLGVMTDPKVNKAPTSACPSEEDLRTLAAGLCSEPVAAKLTQHATQCDRCGPLLREYAEDFSEELSSEDQALLEELKSSSPGWHKKAAGQMLGAASGDASTATGRAGTSSVSLGRKPFAWRWVLIPAAGAICAAIAFGVWYSQRETPERVEKLLAQAYTEQRTVEMRIPYAKHADFHQLRSGDTESLLSSPEPLRKAADLIASQLKKNSDDPKWLLLSARLDILDWHYKPALSTLNKIEDKKVIDSPEMQMVRSLALYERAEIEHEPLTYGEVVDLLGKILQKNPDDPIALFNQAIACEKIHAYECAATNWRRLVQIEKDPGWPAEAQEHLNRIQEKKTPGH